MSKEAMKLALEALTKNSDRVTEIRAKETAITALREALAEQPAQQEPICKLFGTLPVYDKPAQRKPVANNKFTRAWLRLDELPGTMMQGPEGLFGPIPGSTSTWVTTSERERDHQISFGNPMLEVYTSPPAQPQQEPVGKVNELFDEAVIEQCGFDRELLVYTSPLSQRKPLTDDEIHKASTQAGMQEHYMGFHSGFVMFARAIEAAHGIKEQP